MDHRHPIRVAAKRTGMSPHLIRMWERRYSAITPERTPTGRRLYSEEDIERLVLLRRATLEGQSIGQIAQLSRNQLRALGPKGTSAPEETRAYDNEISIDQHLTLCLQSMKAMDAVGLETRLLRASVELGQQTFLDRLLHPLLELTGQKWSDGRFRVAQEHLASAVVRSLLGSMYISSTAGGSEPMLISTTPLGQLHEFGALMASLAAAASGWRTLYLGPNLPAEEIAEAVADRGASAIALSIVYSSNSVDLNEELRKLSELTRERASLLVGGRSAIAYNHLLTDIGAIRIGTLSDLRRELDRLKQDLDSSSLLRGAQKA